MAGRKSVIRLWRAERREQVARGQDEPGEGWGKVELIRAAQCRGLAVRAEEQHRLVLRVDQERHGYPVADVLETAPSSLVHSLLG